MPPSPLGDIKEKKSPDEKNRACADANAYLCRVLTPTNLPTIYLVILGLGGIVVGIGTLKAIEQQAKIMQAGIALQQAQWVDVTKWNLTEEEPFEGHPKLSINFDVVNPTAYPLKTERVEATAGERPWGAGADLQLTYFLPPRAYHTVRVPIILSGKQEEEYSGVTRFPLSFRIVGRVTYRGIDGIAKPQPFAQTCWCSKRTETIFRPYAELTNNKQEHKEKTN